MPPKILREPSIIMRKLLNTRDSDPEPTEGLPKSQNPTEEDSFPTDSFEREHLFIYGTLMDPETLARALSLSDPPIMRRAKIVGYHTKLWAPYPALMDGKPLQPVNGMAFEILSQAQLDQLEAYETEKYKLDVCLIDILNEQNEVERTVSGVTFMWNGEENELQEGKFDLKEWKKERALRELDALVI